MADQFGAYSKYYDLLYQDKDYAGEADYVYSLLTKYANTPRTVLELGCGTGKHAEQLAEKGLIVDGVELSETMLESAQQRAHRLSKRAVLGSFNPHAGDNGLIGTEDAELITTAVAQLKKEDIQAFGPYPADGYFGAMTYRKFDGTLAMYHDQGHIPMKLLAFDSWVNVSMGLPIIRTSVDHGTAFDIAGTGQAREDSMLAAIDVALKMVGARDLT